MMDLTAPAIKQPVLGRKKNYRNFLRTNLPLLSMVLPGLVILIINNYIPMFGVVIAFKQYRFSGTFIESVIKSKWVGFNNFKFFFDTPYAYLMTRNTILYNLLFIVLDVVIPVLLAIALNEIRGKVLSKVYQSIMFLPFFLSWIIVSYLAFSLLSIDKGFINTGILQMFGVAPVEWYNEPIYWPFILIFFHMWKYTGFNIVVYLASISGIDTEFYEAAAIDGATKWQQIKNITLPMLKPLIIIMTLLAVGRIFNADFGLFYNVPRNSGMLKEATMVIDTYVYSALMNTSNIGMAAAAGTYQAVVGCITVFTFNLIVRKIDKDMSLF